MTNAVAERRVGVATVLAELRELPDIPLDSLPTQGWGGRWLTRVGTTLDATVLGAMQMAVDALLMPSPEALPELRASADLVTDQRLAGNPARFFSFCQAPGGATASSSWARNLDGGAVMAREISIRYRPYASERAFENGGRGGAIRDALRFEHWVHGPRRPRATVIALHGFAMGRPRVDALVLMAAQWFALGLDVALVTLPHHGSRSQGARFSGEHFAVPDVGRLAEAVRQAVFEVRLLQQWLRRETEAPVGILGVSLGGYIGALMAGLYDDLDFVVPMVPPVCIGDLAWRFFMRSRHHRQGLPPAFSRDELRTAFRVHSPLAHSPRTPRERLAIVAGRGDRIVPREHPHALWEHWGHPPIHWFAGGHLSPFGRGRIIDFVAERLRVLDIL